MAQLKAGSTVGGTAILLDATDSVDAANIAANAVGSSEIAANAVGSSEIAANAVTLAKMAHGTDGELITYNSSGAPAHVSVGTNGHVLTSNGAGNAPSMQALPSSGADASLSNLSATGENKVCQAWCNFDGTGSAASWERDSYNVSSYVDNGSGDYTVNFSNNMNNTNYCVIGIMSMSNKSFPYVLHFAERARAASYYRAQNWDDIRNVNGIMDAPVAMMSVFGDPS